jgi:hypothetical protein
MGLSHACRWRVRSGTEVRALPTIKIAGVSDKGNSLVCSRKTRCLLTSRVQQVPSVKGQPGFLPFLGS